MEEEEYQSHGEISLAHYGVLFLDELTEFDKNVLETLRGPLEDKKVTISRTNSVITYPCNFIFIASKYISKISGPLLDRIDLHIEVENVEYTQLENQVKLETSDEIRGRVNKARNRQIERYKKYKIYSNAELTPSLIEKYCKIDDKSKELLEKAFKNLELSARGYNKILKIARTIADLEEKEKIEISHIAEAIQYRNLDRKYWS